MFSQHQLPLGNANFFGGDNFVREGILEDAVLMDARFVGERVRSYNGFIGRYTDAGYLRQQSARGIQFVEMEVVVTPRVACRTRSTTATSSSAALPARSPIPLIVNSSWRAPPRIAAREFATPRPRSLWPCALNIIPGAPSRKSMTRRNMASYSSGRA